MNSHCSRALASAMTVRSPVRCITVFFVGCLTTATSHAQDAGLKLEEVMITGTRIRGVDAPVGSNVIAIDADAIARTGLTTTAQLLRSVPQISNVGFDEMRTGGAQRAIANITGCTAMNLRGLGADETLTLLDGRRGPPACGEGRIFDPNTIPTIALQRVEVVADGSSAIYGSDAMTGVVNLITLHEYNGAESRALYGIADGIHQFQAQQLLGHTFDKANVVLALEYTDRTNLAAADRPKLYNDTGSYTAGAFPANTGASGFVDANNNGRIDPGEGAGHPPNTQSNWLGVDALPSQLRKSAFAYGDYKFTDAFKLYTEAYYSKRSSERNNAALSINGATIAAGNPYNATGAPVPGVSYSFINDLGPAKQSGFEEVWQETVGGMYQFSRDWQADFYSSYGEATDFRNRPGINNGARPPAAPTALGAALASTSTATAFDPFSNGSNGYPSAAVKQSVIDSFLGYTTVEPAIDLLDTQLKIDGPFFTSPGGEMRMAVGAEYQKLHRTQVQVSNVTGTTNVGTLVTTVFSPQNRTVTSAFAELFIPIVGVGNAVPGAQRLSVSLAGRYDKYDDTQTTPSLKLLDTSTTNPKFGVTWEPVKDLSVRGTYGKSFRAPALGDYSLGAPTLVGPVNVSAAVAAAYGISNPTNAPTVSVRSIEVQGGHSLGLQPERSRTWSFGVDYKPEELQGFNVSATYYNVRFEDQISIPADLSSLQRVPYVQVLANATGSFVIPGKGFVILNPTTAQVQAYLAHGGTLTPHIAPGITEANLYGTGSVPTGSQNLAVPVLIDALSNNTGVIETDGIDFTVGYTWETGLGNVSVDDVLTYVLSYKQALVSSLPLTDYLNQMNFPLRLRSRAHVGWTLGGWGANAFVNYTNSYDNSQAIPTANVASYVTIDATVGYDTGKLARGNWLSNVNIMLSALNALDKDPPYARVVQSSAAGAFQNFDSQNASSVGRFLSLQVSKRW